MGYTAIHSSWRSVARGLALLVVLLAAAAGGLRHEARAQTPGIALNYHIHGTGLIVYSYTGDQRAIDAKAACEIPIWNSWTLTFDGTLETVGHQIKGTVSSDLVMNKSEAVQCGSQNPPGQPFQCCGKEVDYTLTSVGDTGGSGLAPTSTAFVGSYNDAGDVQMIGDIRILAKVKFGVCSDHFGPHPVQIGAPCRALIAGANNIENASDEAPAALDYHLVITGHITFFPPENTDLSGSPTSTAVSPLRIQAKLDVPSSRVYPWGFKHDGSDDLGYQDVIIDGSAS